MRRGSCGWWVAVGIAGLLPRGGRAADLTADPSTYQATVAGLQAGDTLTLAAGTYPDGLRISDLNGSESAWITIRGPAAGDPAVFEADPGPCCDTVEIRRSSYVAIENLVIDGKDVGGAFGVNTHGGVIHHIRVEGCTFVNHGGGQQHDAISTKDPTWGWVIRRNRVIGAGTGLYLGNSDGSAPFVAGLIEYNLVQDPIGYCMEIKWQQPRPDVPGMPTGPSRTIVRHNVFIKGDGPSPDGDRPNVLFGGWPDSGPGSQDLYEVYGNFFFHNPREALLQASGRVSIHDNVFVDSSSAAIALQDHDLPLKLANVYNNTIYTAGTGISCGSADEGSAVVGNLIFAGNPISGTVGDERENLVGALAEATTRVTFPSPVLSEMDFYPLPGGATGSPIDLTMFAGDSDYDRDFNGTSKGDFTFRGAYAGEGTNPGWHLGADIKGEVPTNPGADGGVGPGTDGGPSSSDGGPSGTGGDSSGCSCRTARRSGRARWLPLLAAAALLISIGRRTKAYINAH